ncbi:hypothetical protein E2C01_032769 [Portunus trituberculatus]|uniref:Uncharacterized protein n=1 Tax=Portunus trituberculatus TaxID=210409 RepID=A0A5B7F1Y2_PORTR|nr:hypothetical protein [Portunus trituberculatus]
MCLGGDMDPNMGTPINKIACATDGRKLNSASHIYSSSMPTGGICTKGSLSVLLMTSIAQCNEDARVRLCSGSRMSGGSPEAQRPHLDPRLASGGGTGGDRRANR